MKRLSKYISGLVMTLGLMFALVSCNNDEPNPSPFVDPKNPNESTILIYAVATNNLFGNYLEDRDEILVAAKDIDLSKNDVIIYQTGYKFNPETNKYTTSQSESALIKLVKTRTGYDWETVYTFPAHKDALNPERVKEVVNFTFQHFSAQTKGMMFWSHSSAANPYLISRSGVEDVTQSYSFGSDGLATDDKYKEINVDELANALPDGLLDFIWFDSCYMGNIESAYQLRNKCKYYVGYPTEVWEWGLPYNLVLPYLTKLEPNYIEAAETFYNYYNDRTHYNNATISVTETSKLDILADFCRSFYQSGNNVSSSSFIEYTNRNGYYFYDLGDYTKAMANVLDMELSNDEWNDVLANVQLYRAATPNLFTGRELPPERYSGYSTHVYNFNDNSDKELYYRSLDWYKAVFE